MPAPLNLFYAEPDPDRWVPLDRHPRRLVRRVFRGAPRPGGQKRVYLNLRAGLDRIGMPYRVNDYQHARRNPGELACIVGKPFLLDRMPWRNPILFGASIFSHPLADPALLERLPVRRVLVPGEWMRKMCEPHYGAAVHAWPVGIDTSAWVSAPAHEKNVDILLYDKVRWEHDGGEHALVGSVRDALAARGLSVMTLRYGAYREAEFATALRRARMMVFLCEHETQGIAYQQALSCGVPVLAWNRGGEWRDPEFWPHRVRFAPVSAVPYWDVRCGVTFRNAEEFPDALDRFMDGSRSGAFAPRDYIMENLTLELCAQRYVEHARAVA